MLLLASLAVSCGRDDSKRKDDPDPIEDPTLCGAHAEAAGWVPGVAPTLMAESSPERIAALGEETWGLSLQLLRALPSSEASNIAHSATSFYVSLGMTYSRFEDQHCGEQIAHVLNFPELGRAFHQTMGAAIQTLEGRSLPGDEYTFPVNLSLKQTRWLFDPAEVPEPTEIEQMYGAAIHTLKNRGEPARELINCVVEEQSGGLIPQFLPPGAIKADAQQHDINVTYLSAPWDRVMYERNVDFTPEGGVITTVPGFTPGIDYFLHYSGTTFDAVQLRLRGALSVLIVLPQQDSDLIMSEFVTELTTNELIQAATMSEWRYLNVRMPNVSILPRSIDYYERFGFDCGPYTLQTAIQAAAVQIDHLGVKAAAVTDGGDGDGDGDEPTEFFVDRPFLFFIYDRETRLVLFSGRVMEID